MKALFLALSLCLSLPTLGRAEVVMPDCYTLSDVATTLIERDGPRNTTITLNHWEAISLEAVITQTTGVDPPPPGTREDIAFASISVMSDKFTAKIYFYDDLGCRLFGGAYTESLPVLTKQLSFEVGA